MIYLELLWVFIQVGLLSFGGGYGSLPTIQALVINQKNWMTFAEYLNFLTIAEMTPGPVAINIATFVGNQTAGLLGGIVATLGVILPSIVIVFILAILFTKYGNVKIIKSIISGIRPAVVGLIAAAALSILLVALFQTSEITQITTINYLNIGIFAIALFVLYKYKASPIILILAGGAVGAIFYFFL